MFDYRPITGYIRFSFFGPTDTRQKHFDKDLAFEQLYNEKRMSARFHLFEHICLPSIKAQTDKDFKIVILSSDIMPELYKNKLLQLTKDCSNIVVDFSETEQIGRALHSHMQSDVDRARFGYHVSFRLDDDDAISQHYIKNLRRVSTGLPKRTAITFPKGITVFPDQKNKIISFQMSRLFHGQGLAWVNNSKFRKNPFQTAHGVIWKRCPSFSYPEFVSYIYTQHLASDTRRYSRMKAERAKTKGIKPGTPKGNKLVEDSLAENFPYLTQEKLHKIIGELYK